MLLLTGQWVRSTSLVVAGLLVLFIGVVSVSMVRGLDIHCGCFSASTGRRVGFKLLGEDIFWLVLAVFVIFRGRDELGWRALFGLRARQ